MGAVLLDHRRRRRRPAAPSSPGTGRSPGRDGRRWARLGGEASLPKGNGPTLQGWGDYLDRLQPLDPPTEEKMSRNYRTNRPSQDMESSRKVQRKSRIKTPSAVGVSHAARIARGLRHLVRYPAPTAAERRSGLHRGLPLRLVTAPKTPEPGDELVEEAGAEDGRRNGAAGGGGRRRRGEAEKRRKGQGDCQATNDGSGHDIPPFSEGRPGPLLAPRPPRSRLSVPITDCGAEGHALARWRFPGDGKTAVLSQRP